VLVSADTTSAHMDAPSSWSAWRDAFTASAIRKPGPIGRTGEIDHANTGRDRIRPLGDERRRPYLASRGYDVLRAQLAVVGRSLQMDDHAGHQSPRHRD